MFNVSGINTQGSPADAGQGLLRLSQSSVMLVGLGNIGSFSAMQFAPLVSKICLVDRDVVELRNVSNQFYGPEHVGLPKVVAMANHLCQVAPHLTIERRELDIEDVPWGDFRDADIVVAGLDSLRSRQVTAERTYSMGIPYVDGAVGDPLLVRVQVLIPGGACLECSFGDQHYRQLSIETPCVPDGATSVAPTGAPSCAGAAAASLVVAQCIRTMGSDAQQSYELNGDLLNGRVVSARRRKSPRCRFAHPKAPKLITLETPFAAATVDDVLRVAKRFASRTTFRLEFRRGVLPLRDDGLFGANRWASAEDLRSLRRQPLEHIGLVDRDHILIHAHNHPPAHIRFRQSPAASAEGGESSRDD